MKYATAEPFRTALEDRLRQQAWAAGLPLVRLRKDVAFERLLARLLVAAPDRWVLKGGLALDYRLGDRARTTKDIDLGRQEYASASSSCWRSTIRSELLNCRMALVTRPSGVNGTIRVPWTRK